MPVSTGMQWEPLLAAARKLGSSHVSLIGSAVRKKLESASDVDVHVVIPRMSRSAFAALADAAREVIRAAAARLGRPCRVELRHGPFKPPPGRAREMQLHLLLDDEASAGRLPCALVAQRAATGILLTGEPLAGRARCNSAATWIREARAELQRWRSALIDHEIAYRGWTFDRRPRLVEGRCPAETSWDLYCLLRGAAAASDVCYRPAFWMTSRTLAPPFFSELGGEPPWKSLLDQWAEVRDRAVSVIDERLNF